MKTYKLKNIDCFSKHTLFTIGRGARVYEYIATATDDNALYMHTLVVLYDNRAQKYVVIDLQRDKRADNTIHIIYQC